MKRRVKIGDVFEIPIDDARVGYGQVVARHFSLLFIVVFGSAYSRTSKPSVVAIVADTVRFAAQSLDAKIWHGDWLVVGNTKPDSGSIGLPVYKSTALPSGEWFVQSWDGRLRPATAEECARLRLRTTYSPQIIEDALKAVHGVIPWQDNYAFLEYEQIRVTKDILV